MKVYIAIMLDNPGKECIHCYRPRESRKRTLTLLIMLQNPEKRNLTLLDNLGKGSLHCHHDMETRNENIHCYHARESRK